MQFAKREKLNTASNFYFSFCPELGGLLDTTDDASMNIMDIMGENRSEVVQNITPQ